MKTIYTATNGTKVSKVGDYFLIIDVIGIPFGGTADGSSVALAARRERITAILN